MRGLIKPDSSSVDCASHLPSSSQPGSSVMAAPPAKRAKELSKVLGCCLGNSHSVQLTPQQRVKTTNTQVTHIWMLRPLLLSGGRLKVFDT